MSAPPAIDIRRILDLLPHRYPFLLVDRVLEADPGKRVVAIKCVSMNEPFFQGHFPAAPVMPGVLIVEAMAQAAGVLMMMDIPDRASKLFFFAGIDGCRFRRPVVPGDVLRLEAEVLQVRMKTARIKASATVDGELVAEATLLSSLVDKG